MEFLDNAILFAGVLAPILTAITQLVKKTISIPKNFIPVVSVVLGLILGVIAYPFTDLDLVLRLWAGGFAGLAGTGLFELVKPRPGVSKSGK